MTDTQTRGAPLGVPRRSLPVVIALCVCALVILATTIFIVVQILRVQWHEVDEAVMRRAQEQEEQTAHAHEHPPAEPFTQAYEIQGMTISLANRNQTLSAFAEFNLVLDCPSAEAKHWMEMNRASIRDVVYESTISFTVEDFSRPEGFGRIKKAILDGLKARFGAHAPRDMLLKDWVIR